MSSKKQKKITDKETITLIEKGAFADSYLIYGRRSTDDTDTQKNSLAYQKSENLRFARKEHLPIAKVTLKGFSKDGIISERHSAFTEKPELIFGDDNTVQYTIERPKFFQLAVWLSERYFKGVIYLCWDRASRNKGDETILRKLMKTGVDIQFVLAKYEKTSAGELHMDIDGMFSIHHSRVTSEKVSLTIKESRENGLVTYRAPVGYLNEGTMEHKPFDTIRVPIIREMFDKAATGEWSLADLARWAKMNKDLLCHQCVVVVQMQKDLQRKKMMYDLKLKKFAVQLPLTVCTKYSPTIFILVELVETQVIGY